MEKQKQDCADVHRRRRGGDDRPVVRCSAALQALLSGERGTSCSRCVRPAGVTTVCVLCLSGVGARRHGGGRTRRRTGGDDEAGEGTYHQDHLQRRPTRWHAVELQTAADGDLCKTWFLSPRLVLVRILVLNCAKCLSVVQVVPGETALAFYRAKNPTDKPITGISTYNVVPFEAGQYFNKIQVVLLTSPLSSPPLCPP